MRERRPELLRELFRDIIQRDFAHRHGLRETRHLMNPGLPSRTKVEHGRESTSCPVDFGPRCQFETGSATAHLPFKSFQRLNKFLRVQPCLLQVGQG